MRTVAIGSIFRNSSRYLGRYFLQVKELERQLALQDITLRPIFVEGDSTDDTRAHLTEFALMRKGGVLHVREHGGPVFGSVDVTERWSALAWCCNGVMSAVSVYDDALIYVESDLIWEAETMVSLLELVKPRIHDVATPAVAPMCFTQAGLFYDVYGHRKDGVPFSPFPPYHPGLVSSEMTDIDSAGSCIVMRGDVARVARFGATDCVLGLGKSIWDNGFSLWVVPMLKVVHP